MVDSTITKDELDRNYTKYSDDAYVKVPTSYPYDNDAAVKQEMGSYYTSSDTTRFPPKIYDFEGKSGSTWNSDNYDNVETNVSGRNSLLTLTHSAYDKAPNGKIYRVLVHLERAESAKAESDGGQGTEWYLDHIGGYQKADESIYCQDKREDPSRGNQDEGGMSGVSFDIHYDFNPISVEPDCMGAVVSRPFEKDNRRPDNHDSAYQNTTRDWCDLFKSTLELCFDSAVPPVTFSAYAFQVATLLANAVQDKKNQDDLFHPAITAFSNGACRWIYENYSKNGNNFYIRRICDGLEATSATITETGNSSHILGWAGLFDVAPQRSIQLIYRVRVEEVGGYPIENTGYIVTNKNNKQWFVHNWGLLIEQGNSYVDRNFIYFKQTEDGFYHIYTTASSTEPGGGRKYYYLCIQGDSLENGAKVAYEFESSGLSKKWKLESTDDGRFYIINAHSNKAIRPLGGVVDFADDLEAEQWDKGEGNVDAQKWKLTVF